jgi:hypothetical protein
MEQLTPHVSNIFRASGAGPDERGRLDATLARMGQLYEALEGGSSDVDAAAVLSQLRVDLSLHFALEEGDEYFGAVLRERPSLSHDISALRREHGALLDELDALRALAADAQRSPRLGAAILHLVAVFREHEHKEADLLQESVLRDDGVGAD